MSGQNFEGGGCLSLFAEHDPAITCSCRNHGSFAPPPGSFKSSQRGAQARTISVLEIGKQINNHHVLLLLPLYLAAFAWEEFRGLVSLSPEAGLVAASILVPAPEAHGAQHWGGQASLN